MRKRSERGAVAVVVALSSLMLFGVAATAVDLGNGMARKRDVQSQADLAALAAAGNLPGTKSATDPVVEAAADYLNHNQPQSDGNSCVPTEDCVEASDLVDGDPLNGEIYFQSATRVKVVAPPAHVQFGIASAIGFSDVDVRAEATAGVFSPGPAVLPVYAAEACSWGPQDVTATSNPPDPSPPVLAEPDDDNGRFALADPGNPPSNPSPASVPMTTTPTGTLTVKGSNLDRVSRVGFFPEGGGSPITVDRAAFDAASDAAKIVLSMPSTVTSVEAVWWIRLDGPNAQNNPVDEWTPVTKPNGDLATVPFKVGDAGLECSAEPSAGNFGTLRLPRETGTSSDWLPMNIATGLEKPLSLHIYPGSPNVSAECSGSDGDPTVYSTVTGNPDLKPLTNCVVSDPGLTAATVSDGMVTGPGNGIPGRLSVATANGCGSDRTVVLNSGTGPDTSYTINNEYLSCYFLTSAPSDTTIANVTPSNYTYNGGEPVISSDIYKSPRFFWVPVLKQVPAPGLSTWKIVDMRAAFLTDQPPGATKSSPAVSADNGLTVVNKKIDQVHVIFFNDAAVEQPDGGPRIDWLGGNLPKLVQLVD